MSSSLFQGTEISELYCLYRPRYPHELYERIDSYMKRKLSPPYEHAVDVGCGSGQATGTLAKYFDHVTGIDISQSQIEEANAHCKKDNITFRIGSFDAIPMADNTCELVISLMAAHWFEPLAAFYQEADRVLKPGGCLVVASHGREMLTFIDGHTVKDLTSAFHQFHNHPLIQKYLKQGNREIESKYAGWRLPYDDQTRYDDMQITQDLTIDQYIGLVMSRSFVHSSIHNHPEKDHPVYLLRRRLMEATNQASASEDIKIKVSFPLFALFGRKTCF